MIEQQCLDAFNHDKLGVHVEQKMIILHVWTKREGIIQNTHALLINRNYILGLIILGWKLFIISIQIPLRME